MKKNYFHNRNSILYRFIMSYIVIFIFALTIGVVVYHRTLNVVKNEVREGTIGILEQTKEVIDMRFEEMKSISHQIENNPSALQLLNVKNPYQGTNTYKVIESMQSLYEYNISNQFILNYFLLFKDSDLALNNNFVSTIPQFYQFTFQPVNKKYLDWYEELFEKYYQKKILPVDKYIYNQKNYSIITYIDTLGYPNNFDAIIIILIDNANIQQMLKGIDISNGGWVYITDGMGNIISYVSDDESIKPKVIEVDTDKNIIQKNIDSTEMMVTHTKSMYSDWTYVAVQPTNIVMKKVEYINKITAMILVSTFLFGLFLSYYLAHRNAKPIQKIFQNHEELQHKIEEQLPLMRSVVFERVFKGEISTAEEIKVLLNHIGVNINNELFVVVLLHFQIPKGTISKKILKRQDVIRVIAKDVLNDFVGENGYYHDVEENKIALILNNNTAKKTEFKNKIKNLLHQLNNEFQSSYQINTVLAVGNIYSNIINISRSYEEATQALNYNISDINTDIFWFGALKRNRNSYYYPNDVELRLTNLAKSGEKNG